MELHSTYERAETPLSLGAVFICLGVSVNQSWLEESLIIVPMIE